MRAWSILTFFKYKYMNIKIILHCLSSLALLSYYPISTSLCYGQLLTKTELLEDEEKWVECTPVVVLTRIWVSFAISIRSLHRASRLDYPWPTPGGGNGPFQGRRTTDMRIVIIDSSSSVDSPSVAFLLHLLLPFLPLLCFLTTLQSGSALSAPGR